MAADDGRHFALASITLLIMTSLGSYVFGIQAFDLLIRIESPNPEIHDALNRYLFPPLQRNQTPTNPDINLRIERAPNEIRVLVNQEFIASAVSLDDATLATVKALDDAVVHRLKTLHAVHAGAVLLDDKALLLPGSTHAGKSSLVAELLRRGAIHFSDEYALIDADGCVRSYPRPLLLRNGRPQQSLVLPEELNSRFASQSAPVGWLVAIDYSPAAEWDVQAISQSEAIMLLLRNTPHEMAKSPTMLDYFQSAVEQAACYKGRRGDVGESADRLVELIRQK
jgi:hypothetical protein